MRGELAPGDLVDGKFEILGVLGSGAMGTVHLAEHRSVGRQVAIKVLGPGFGGDHDHVRRFRAEARSSAAIRHPNIVDVLDAGELPDGRPYIVMEHLVGRSLFAEVHRVGPLPVARACAIVRDVARAVAAAHATGIVHRDLKPENIMLVVLGGTETVKVLDFGIAAQLGSSRRTAPGILLGTPEYMAPEQAVGAGPDPAIDVYALGALLFELVTGHPPFSGNPIEILVRKASSPAPRLDQETDGRVSVALADLVASCLEADPSRRPTSAEVVADRLGELGGAEPAHAPRPSRTLVAPTRPRSSRSAITTASAVAIAALVVFAVRQRSVDAASAPPTVAAASLASALEDAGPRSESTRADLECREDEVWTLAFETESVIPAPVAATVSRTPTSRVEPSAPRFDTAGCERTRHLAILGRKRGDWHSVLHHTARPECWAGSGQRDRLRVRALLELERYEQCAALGRGLVEPDWRIRWWLRRCEQRAGRRPSTVATDA